MRRFFLIWAVGMCFWGGAWACEACAIPRIGKHAEAPAADARPAAHFDFTFEQQNWDEIPAPDAHELHEQGHHVHDKTHEEFYHFSFGFDPAPRWSVTAEIPYVVRGSIEIHDDERLGEIEESQGIGDMLFLGTYRVLENADGHLGIVAGVKIPTGSTEKENSAGELFEPELQPGTGSTDVPFGLVWRLAAGGWEARGNAVYVVKSEGDQDFEYGDLFSTSVFADYPVRPAVRAGFDFNYQHEGKQREEGVKTLDSGGDTILLGPMVSVEAGSGVSLTASVLFPVFQDLGGVHQELDFSWQAGGRVAW